MIVCPTGNGPAVVSVFTIEMAAEAPTGALLPELSVVVGRSGAGSVAVALELLSNAPTALIVAVTVIVVFAPDARLAMVHGSAAQPPPLTFVMVRLVGVSVT